MLVWVFDSSLGVQEAELFGVDVGSASSEGVVETLAATQAVRLWGSLVGGKFAELDVRSDSKIALAVLGKLANATPALNFLGAELALELEFSGVHGLKCTHLPGALNVCADYLSRLFAPQPVAAVPHELKDIHIKEVPSRAACWFRLPPPGLNPGLWGDRAGLSALASAAAA